VKLSADGQQVMKYSDDGTIEQWDISTDHLLTIYRSKENVPLKYYPGTQSSLFSPDARFMITEFTRVLDAATREQLTSFTDGNFPLSFSPDGRSLITIRNDPPEKLSKRHSYLTIWNTKDFKELSTFIVPEGVYKIVWSPTGETVAIVGLEFDTRIIDTATGRENGRLPYGNCWPWTMCGSDGCEPLNFSADGAVIVKQKEPIKLWRVKDVSLIRVLEGAHLPAAFSPVDNQLLATRSKDKKILLVWRVAAT
jgi:WD40 repeat protein